MARIVPFRDKKRLRGLDEFEVPAFVGRMARVERSRRWRWYVALAAAVGLGATIGLLIL